ncbi:MAG TPA: UbiA family prenyltransferase [Myxococcaceae bacterium]|nr:UbiA family prenyltransferase [Myxococcaceae bacterium]
MSAVAVRVRTYLRLGRVSNLPTVWTNVVAGAVLAGGSAAPRTLVPLCLALSLFYVAGMFLNDAFDRRFDARARPDRPIPAGEIGAAEVFGWGYAMLGTGVLILLAQAYAPGGPGTPWPAVSGLVLAGAIVLYDVWHKANPASPLLMGTCRFLVYATAALAAGGRLSTELLAGAAMLLSYVAGLTYAAKQEDLGHVRRWWPLALVAAPFVYAVPAVVASVAGAVLYAVFLACVAYATSLLRRGGASIGRAVAFYLAGISLLDGLLLARARIDGAALLGAGGLFMTLFFQRYVRGT